MLTRSEAASQVAATLEAAGYSASAWEGGPCVRVYVKQVELKSKGRRKVTDCGYLEITDAGEISTEHTARQAGTIRSLIGDLEIAPATVQAVQPVAANGQQADEDVAQFERSQRAIASQEASREIW